MLLHQAGHAERQERRDQRGALLAHVAAVDDRRDDRGIRRGPADAALLQVLDQGRLGVARRRGRGVALGTQLGAPEGVALAHRRQPPVGRPTAALGPGLVVADLVRALLVRGEEPGEQRHRARRRELDVPAVGGARTQPHGGRRQPRIGHLGGDRALPDQLVQRELVGADASGQLRGACERVPRRADRLVRLLGVLDLAGRTCAGSRRRTPPRRSRSPPAALPEAHQPTASSSRCAYR